METVGEEAWDDIFVPSGHQTCHNCEMSTSKYRSLDLGNCKHTLCNACYENAEEYKQIGSASCALCKKSPSTKS
jgi:predicted sulfurtransferase